MEELLSNGVRHQTLPEKYIFPPEHRPGNLVSTCKTVPVIDLGGTDRDDIINQILKAGKEFGFFQVVNHGVPEEVISGMMGVAEEFFAMPVEDKALYFSEDPNKVPKLFTGSHVNGGRYWRDALRLICYPVEQYMHLYPEKPRKFRKILARYAVEAKELATTILKLISKGIGLEEDYFNGDFSGGYVDMHVNHYVPCPDPSLTMGLPKHCDPNLITILLQGNVSGLQVLHYGEWVGVEPIPNAFVVNFGHLLEFITNGLLRSVEHCAVTNPNVTRTTIGTFIRPTDDCLIAPAKFLVHEHHVLGIGTI